jgi:hypothetical protein
MKRRLLEKQRTSERSGSFGKTLFQLCLVAQAGTRHGVS